jgi:hypothetical protein
MVLSSLQDVLLCQVKDRAKGNLGSLRNFGCRFLLLKEGTSSLLFLD